jgi:hypothetical protein
LFHEAKKSKSAIAAKRGTNGAPNRFCRKVASNSFLNDRFTAVSGLHCRESSSEFRVGEGYS